MIKRTLLVAVLIFIAPAAYGIQEPVVGVYTDFGNRRGQGTGFCISASGDILTAYHVVYGARRVDVQYGGIQFKDVVIQSVLPETDLALLKLPKRPQGLSCYQLAKKWSAGQPVYAIGYARGIPNQRYDGTVTRRGTLRSEQFRDDKGRKLFENDGIKLISLDVTIENGISGSPVMTADGVIGVLSGSLEVGRRLSWAIPVSYLQSMRPLGRRASEITKWPKFGMTKNWTNLRNMFRVDNTVAKLLDHYFSSVDDLVTAFDEIRVKVEYYRGGYIVMNTLMSDYMKRVNSGASQSDLETLLSTIKVMGETQLFPRLELCIKAFDQSGEAESRLKNSMFRLYSHLKKFYSGLPRTEMNLKNSKEFNQAAYSLAGKFDTVQEKIAQVDPMMLKALKILGQLDSVDSADKLRIMRILKEGFATFELALQNRTSLESVSHRNNLIEIYREIGELFEWLFYRDWDRGDKIYRYTSKHGYSIVMPKGWVKWTPALMNLLPKGSISAPGPEVDLCFVKTGFFGDKRKYLDVMATSPHAVSPPLTDPFIQNTAIVLKAELESLMPNFRSFSIGRATFGKNKGILVQGLYGPLNNPFKLHNAWLVGSGRSVWLNGYIRSGDSLDDCKAIANSLEFK